MRICIFPWSEALFQQLLDLYNMCPISSAVLCPLIEDLSYIRFLRSSLNISSDRGLVLYPLIEDLHYILLLEESSDILRWGICLISSV